MGFLKNLKGNLTGNWATVTLRTGEARRGGTLPVGIDVAVKDNDISPDSIVLEIRCNEVVHVPNHRAAGSNVPSDVHESSSLHDQQVPVSGPLQLAAGAQQSIDAELPIPGHLPPSFVGRHARVEWAVRARIEMKGNDPDSGWQDITVV